MTILLVLGLVAVFAGAVIALAAVGARRAGGAGAGDPARRPPRVVTASAAQARSGAVAKAARPSSGVTCAVKPSSAAARSGEATTCRTSPSRYWPVTRGARPCSDPDATCRATSEMAIGRPEHTL